MAKAVPFPSVIGVATTSYPSTDTATQVVNMPGSIAAGDLLLAFVGTQGSKTIATPSGWTLLFNAATGTGNSNRRLQVFSKVATGSEGSTQNFTCSPSGLGSWSVYLVRNQGDVYASSAATGTSTTPNPPSLSPTPGSDNYLWFAAFVGRSGATSVYPSGYSNGLKVGGTSSSNVNQSTAYKTAAGASDDPGAFTMGSSDGWVAATLAIRKL